MNCKSVCITARVPFDWLNDFEAPLPDEDVAYVARFLMTPSSDLKYVYSNDGFIPSKHGGQTAMYKISITGISSASWTSLDRLAAIIARKGTISRALAMDVEDPASGGWFELKTGPIPAGV